MDARSISLAHFPFPSKHAGIPSRPSVLWFRLNCGFVSFLLRCLGRNDHLVAFFSIAALVATDKMFVIPTATAECVWKLGIRVLICASLLIGLGFMYLIPPNLLWVTFVFRLDWCNIFYLIKECSFRPKKK
ncbi:hypothetical protein DVH24_005090 [Malus domestica]|uniref:Uncharacterized protein n=1 Tax=Malus domestica TaxID=3750 RepID=A0A498ICI8_MALDO|nr:hypothetical protein DVH24_005090 [Malus domestica]